jgi:large subunit ribosomal protein L1
MEKEAVIQALQKAMDASKERKFVQSIDLSINFKGLDFKKPENRIDMTVQLPFPSTKPKKIILFAKDKTFADSIKSFVDEIVMEDRISSLEKKEVKKLASAYDVFLAEGQVMVSVGKHLGQILSPQGKMPSPVPANAKAVQATVERLKKSIRLTNKKGKYMPVVHASIGNEKMPLEQLAENILAVYNAILPTLEGEKNNIRSVFVKKTMGPAVQIPETGKPVKEVKSQKEKERKPEAQEKTAEKPAEQAVEGEA